VTKVIDLKANSSTVTKGKKMTKKEAYDLIMSKAPEYIRYDQMEKEAKANKGEVRSESFMAMDVVFGRGKGGKFDLDDYWFGRFTRGGGEYIDEDVLKTELGSKLWRKVTRERRELDPSKLRKAVKEGLVSKTAVEAATFTKEPTLVIIAREKKKKTGKDVEDMPSFKVPPSW